MSSVLTYLRSGKSISSDKKDDSVSSSDDESEKVRKSSGPFLGFDYVSENNGKQSTTKKSTTKNSKGKNLSVSGTGDSSVNSNSSGSGDNPPVGPTPVGPSSTPSDDPVLPSGSSNSPPPPPPPPPSNSGSDDDHSNSDDSDSDIRSSVNSDSESESDSDMASGDSVDRSFMFKGVDFVNFNRRIGIILDSKNLGKTLEENNTCSDRKKAKALGIIVSHIDNTILRLVKESKCPRKFLSELSERYASENGVLIVEARTALGRLDISRFATCRAYCEEVSSLVNQLESAGVTVTNSEVYAYMLQGLEGKPQFDHIRTTASGLLHVSPANPNVLASLLKGEDEKRKKENNSKTLHVNLGTALVTEEKKEVLRCHRCKKEGHLASSCRVKIVCYRCRKVGHIGKKCPTQGDHVQEGSNEQNSASGSTTESSGSSKTSTSISLLASQPENNIRPLNPRPSLALSAFDPVIKIEESISFENIFPVAVQDNESLINNFLENRDVPKANNVISDSLALANFSGVKVDSDSIASNNDVVVDIALIGFEGSMSGSISPSLYSSGENSVSSSVSPSDFPSRINSVSGLKKGIGSRIVVDKDDSKFDNYLP